MNLTSQAQLLRQSLKMAQQIVYSMRDNLYEANGPMDGADDISKKLREILIDFDQMQL